MRERVRELNLSDDIQRTPGREQEPAVTEQLERPREFAARPSHASRHSGELPPILREENDDAVGFAEIALADDDP
jgi:hypothetical protein